MEKRFGYLLMFVAALAVAQIACGGAIAARPASTAIPAASTVASTGAPSATLAPASPMASTLPGAATLPPGSTPAPQNTAPPSASEWQEEFGIAECALAPIGRNPYFILEPGFQLVLEGGNVRLAITVLNETKTVNGVVTRVVEEKEWSNGQVIEVAKNFFAICEKTKDVFYFGEEVDMYQGGKLVSHTGAWLVGENGARAGLIMPGQPRAGMKYYQEIAPSVAMDRAEIISLDYTLRTPAGSFSQCLRAQEGTALNSQEREFKVYAPGIGLVQDANLLLTKYGFMP